MLIQVKNLFPYTKAHTINGIEYLFKAFEIKQVPDSFMNLHDNSPKFPGTLIINQIKEDGGVTKNYIRHIQNYVNPNQEWVYIFEKDGQKHEVKELKKFCESNNLNMTSIRNYIKDNRIYKGWKVSKKKME